MSINSMPLITIKCLILTIIVELLVALILGIRDKKDIINVILVNIITNPVVVLTTVMLYMNFGRTIEIFGIIVLEILAVIVEGLIYKKVLNFKKINPFLLSLILNASSFIVGEIIGRL